MNKLLEMAKEVREASFDIAVETLMIQAEAMGYKTEEPEEYVRWELAKKFYTEFKKEYEL